MDDSKIIAATITASVALLVGLANLIFSIIVYRNKKKSDLDLEKLKSDLAKDQIAFDKSSDIDKEEFRNRRDVRRRILSDLQRTKDIIYEFLKDAKINNKVNLEKISILDEKMDNTIKLYAEIYMYLNDTENFLLHELKNKLHDFKMQLSYLSRMPEGQISKNKKFKEADFHNLVGMISELQISMITNE